MSKKSRTNRNRAVYLVELAKMTDEELDALSMAMPTSDPRFPAVFQEFERRMPQRIQAIAISSPLSEEETQEIMGEVLNPETFERFLDETGSREEFNRIAAGYEGQLEQVVEAINDNHSRLN